ncbi:hypothetical protein ACFL0T_06670 [Candidatus Omnitrophota bacterium]
MLGGYLAINKEQVVLVDRVVAVLKYKHKKRKSKIVLSDADYYTPTTSKKMIERLCNAKRQKQAN